MMEKYVYSILAMATIGATTRARTVIGFVAGRSRFEAEGKTGAIARVMFPIPEWDSRQYTVLRVEGENMDNVVEPEDVTVERVGDVE